MFDTLILTFAIVSSPTPTPPSTTAQQNCQYSAMVNADTHRPVYKCYTEAEWSQKQANDAAVRAKENAEFQAFWVSTWDWIVSNWWKAIIWAVCGVISAFIAFSIYDTIDQKRRPWLYDENGFRKDFYL